MSATLRKAQIGANLYLARKRAGRTQAWLAKAACVPHSSVSLYESGTRNLKRPILLLFAQALEIDPGEISPDWLGAPASPATQDPRQ